MLSKSGQHELYFGRLDHQVEKHISFTRVAVLPQLGKPTDLRTKAGFFGDARAYRKAVANNVTIPVDQALDFESATDRRNGRDNQWPGNGAGSSFAQIADQHSNKLAF